MGVNAELVELMGPQLELLLPELDEKSRRLVLGAVARAAGDGGITAVGKATGASWQTVANGAAELESGGFAAEGRVRLPGAGRPRLARADPGLVPGLLALVRDSARGDPESPLLWTTKSAKNLSDELTAQGHRCSPQTAWRLLHEQGFSTQANAKVTEGRRHPDRDAQFRYIAGQAKEHLAAGQPVISVDAKKKEQVGEYAQAGAEWRPRGDPVKVRSHSFDEGPGGHAIPYGIYDVGANAGFVNVGTDHNTAALAVESIRRWWNLIGTGTYPGATRLLVCCDAGGSNGRRNRAWKAGLAAFAQETGLEITVCHFPPGTSKWNKIEHRLFSQITLNWRGRPLTSHDVVVNTIAATATATGLTVTAVLDEHPYPTGAQVSDQQMRDLEDRALTRHAFHGEWNYTLPAAPRPAPPPQPPPRPGPDPAVLDGLAAAASLTRQDLDDLAAAITTSWHAHLEAQLYQARGGPRPRRHASPGPARKLTLAAAILLTIAADRDGAAPTALGTLTGLDHHTITLAITRTRGPLARHRPDLLTPAPGPRPTQALRDYAARHGITLRRPPAARTQTPTTPILKPPAHRKHNLFWNVHPVPPCLPEARILPAKLKTPARGSRSDGTGGTDGQDGSQPPAGRARGNLTAEGGQDRWAARVKRGSGEGSPQARAAAISPTRGANLAPWPEHGEQTTNGPRRSRMKSSLAVEVYRQVTSPTGSGSRPGRRSATNARTRCLACGLTVPSRPSAVVTVPLPWSPILIAPGTWPSRPASRP